MYLQHCHSAAAGYGGEDKEEFNSKRKNNAIPMLRKDFIDDEALAQSQCTRYALEYTPRWEAVQGV